MKQKYVSNLALILIGIIIWSDGVIAQNIWEELVLPYPYGSFVEALLSTKDSSMLAVSEYEGILKLGKNDWKWRYIHDSPTWGSPNALVQSRSGAILMGTDTELQRSTDSGEKWYPVGFKNQWIYALAADTSGNVYAYQEGVGIFKSSNDGMTWMYSNLWIKGGACMYYEKRRNTLYVSTPDSIFRSTDQGISWKALKTPRFRITCWSSMDNGDVFVGTDDALSWGCLFRSRDDCETWEKLGMIPDRYPYGVNALAINSLGHIFTSGQGIAVSYDSGATGQPYMYGFMSDAAFCFAFDKMGRLYAGATVVVYRTKKSTTAISSTDNAHPLSVELAVPYPSPAREYISIEYGVPRTGIVLLTLHDALGRNVRTLVQGESPPGRHLARTDLRGLPAGVYSLRFAVQGSVGTKFVTVVR